MIYKVTENEFQFLLVFSEITMLTPNELTNPDLLEDVGSLLESLKAKGYFSSENNEYYMPEELTFFMNVIRNPYAVFTLTAESKKMWVFFKEDAIILILKEKDYAGSIVLENDYVNPPLCSKDLRFMLEDIRFIRRRMAEA